MSRLSNVPNVQLDSTLCLSAGSPRLSTLVLCAAPAPKKGTGSLSAEGSGKDGQRGLELSDEHLKAFTQVGDG